VTFTLPMYAGGSASCSVKAALLVAAVAPSTGCTVRTSADMPSLAAAGDCSITLKLPGFRPTTGSVKVSCSWGVASPVTGAPLYEEVGSMERKVPRGLQHSAPKVIALVVLVGQLIGHACI
jgi:hypothetical protein